MVLIHALPAPTHDTRAGSVTAVTSGGSTGIRCRRRQRVNRAAGRRRAVGARRPASGAGLPCSVVRLGLQHNPAAHGWRRLALDSCRNPVRESLACLGRAGHGATDTEALQKALQQCAQALPAPVYPVWGAQRGLFLYCRRPHITHHSTPLHTAPHFGGAWLPRDVKFPRRLEAGGRPS